MSDKEEDDPFEEYRKQLRLQDERMRRESALTGWEKCRYLDEDGKRCSEPSHFGGYCQNHLPEYPYPRLVEHPRDRWRDASIIASSPNYIMILLYWLVGHNWYDKARDLVCERSDEIENILRSEYRVTREAQEVLYEWYDSMPKQAIESRIYFTLQRLHDIGYEKTIRGFCESGIRELEL